MAAIAGSDPSLILRIHGEAGIVLSVVLLLAIVWHHRRQRGVEMQQGLQKNRAGSSFGPFTMLNFQ